MIVRKNQTARFRKRPLQMRDRAISSWFCRGRLFTPFVTGPRRGAFSGYSMTPQTPVAAVPKTCQPEAIRRGWLKDLNVNTSDDASSLAILCSGHLQVATHTAL
jgi:hypothetical protein